MALFDVFGEMLVQDMFENRRKLEFRLHQRRLRDMSDPFQLPKNQFKSLFRLNQETAIQLINMISPHLVQGHRATIIPHYIKVLSVLHFYASGSYQLSSGQGYNFSLSQPSMSKCITEVTEVIYTNLLKDWIVFPKSRDARDSIKRKFFEKFGFPALGAIDCTHISLKSPPEDYPAYPYYCRKGYYSINCQIITDSDLTILSMNARYPGSTHDSAIWQASSARTTMQNLYIQGEDSYLIGDSGYPLQPFLLTPFENVGENTPEANYNKNFIRARNCIERLNGVLKSRFRCLSKHRVLNYDPVKAGKIIYSCGVLHNIAQFYKDIYEGDAFEEEDDLENLNNVNQEWHRIGQEVRNRIVEQYFN